MRRAYPSPKQCFALSYHERDPVCMKCEFAQKCRQLMGNTANCVSALKMRFDLVPRTFTVKKFRENDSIDPDELALADLWTLCYETVYKRKPPHPMSSSYTDAVCANARAAGVPVRMFLLVNLFMNYTMRRKKPLHPKQLTLQAAVTVAAQNAEACRKKFAVFDDVSLGLLYKNDIAKLSVEARLLNSEIIVGTYIVGWRLQHGSSDGVFEAMFVQCEHQLDPTWLAINDDYFEIILKPHLLEPFGSAMQNRQRHLVCQLRATLKRKPAQARPVFLALEKIMTDAVIRVLTNFNLALDHFTVPDRPITDHMLLWHHVAKAITQLEMFKLINGVPGYYTRFL